MLYCLHYCVVDLHCLHAQFDCAFFPFSPNWTSSPTYPHTWFFGFHATRSTALVALANWWWYDQQHCQTFEQKSSDFDCFDCSSYPWSLMGCFPLCARLYRWQLRMFASRWHYLNWEPSPYLYNTCIYSYFHQFRQRMHPFVFEISSRPRVEAHDHAELSPSCSWLCCTASQKRWCFMWSRYPEHVGLTFVPAGAWLTYFGTTMDSKSDFGAEISASTWFWSTGHMTIWLSTTWR